MLRTLLFIFLALGFSSQAASPGSDSKTNALAVSITPAEKRGDAAIIPDATHKPVFTTNTILIAGQRVTYIAEAGMLPVLSATGTVRASVFYVAYTRQGDKAEAGNRKAETRPVTFCFNGGPGSSSVRARDQRIFRTASFARRDSDVDRCGVACDSERFSSG